MYRNSNSVFTQKMLPIGKSPIYNSVLNEYQNNDTSSKLVMKYATNPTSRQQFIARSLQVKSDNAVTMLGLMRQSDVAIRVMQSQRCNPMRQSNAAIQSG